MWVQLFFPIVKGVTLAVCVSHLCVSQLGESFVLPVLFFCSSSCASALRLESTYSCPDFIVKAIVRSSVGFKGSAIEPSNGSWINSRRPMWKRKSGWWRSVKWFPPLISFPEVSVLVPLSSQSQQDYLLRSIIDQCLQFNGRKYVIMRAQLSS